MLDLDEHQYSLSPTDFNLIFSQIDHFFSSNMALVLELPQGWVV